MKAHQLVDFLVRKGFNEFAYWVVQNSADDTPTVDVIRSTGLSQRGDLLTLVEYIDMALEKYGHSTFHMTFRMRADAIHKKHLVAFTFDNPDARIDAYYVYRDKVAVLIADAIGFLYGDPERIVYEEEE